jgi:diketogulonate reductase-like aldo/keto reductase
MHTVNAHGASIPVIGFGTWPMKGEECVRAVTAAIEAGCRHIDTAAGYENERDVGDAIRASGIPREEIFITTKIRPWDLAEGDMQRAAAKSLRNLQLEQVDLILIHWPSRTLPVGATIASLNDVKRCGIARFIGVSNFTIKLLDEAWEATEQPLAVNQCEYHPYLNQDRLIEACHRRAMAFTAYSPIAQGEVLNDPVVRDIAYRVDRKPAQVVLRWLVQQDGVVAIPKSATPERIRDNLRVFDFELASSDMNAIAGLARPDGRLVRDPDLAPDWDD